MSDQTAWQLGYHDAVIGYGEHNPFPADSGEHMAYASGYHAGCDDVTDVFDDDFAA